MVPLSFCSSSRHHVFSHLFFSMGQDPPFCLLSPDRRYALPFFPLSPELTHPLSSLSPTDGSLWSEPQSGNPAQSRPIPPWLASFATSFLSSPHIASPSRGTSDPSRSQGEGTRRTTTQSQCNAIHKQGQELVCSVIRGTSSRLLISLRHLTHHHSCHQELISFPTISLPRHIRQALLVPPPDYHQLPESTPNPSLEYMSEDYAVMSNSFMYTPQKNSNGNSNGSGQSQKMRIPMERRYARPFLNHPISSSFHFIPISIARVTTLLPATTPTLLASPGPQKYESTTETSQRPSKLSRSVTIQPLPPSLKVSSSGNAPATLAT